MTTGVGLAGQPRVAPAPVAWGGRRDRWFFSGMANPLGGLVVACMAYDRAAHGRVHPAFLWGGLLVIASGPLRIAIGRSDAWLSFAGWLIG
ncbi:MAG: hypothetical protein H0V43_02585 [Gemmatimonadales bacterium]|nr:hypothetical protein [Gemmatimonadales bacterium]MBA3554342.1 hypothetical protein [Gemmatimonadales bacterium]